MALTSQQAVLTRFGKPHRIKVVEQALRPLQSHEVRVRIEASTVSATDTLIRKGLYPLLRKQPPFVLGYDFVGVVEAVGGAVGAVEVGDRVADICQIGGNATHIHHPAQSLLRVPTDISAADASTLILSGMTAYQIFRHCASLQPGNSFLVHGGSGAVGSTLLQLCQLFGVRTVTTASGSKHDAICHLADEIIDYRQPDYFKQLRAAAKGGFDAAFDFTNQRNFDQSWRLLKPGGRLVASGIQSLAQQVERRTPLAFARFSANFGLLMAKLVLWNALPNGKHAQFFGIVDSKRDHPERYQADLDELFALIRGDQLTPIHQTFPLDEVPRAHELLDQGGTIGHIVVRNPV